MPRPRVMYLRVPVGAGREEVPGRFFCQGREMSGVGGEVPSVRTGA